MKKLSESIWADIRNKSLGREVRKEFKLNDLSAKEFKEYIEDQYTVVSKIYKPFYIESTESVSIPICFYKKPEPDYPDYMKDLYVYYGCQDHTFYTWNDINKDIFNTLKDNYKTHTYGGCDFTEFSPKDGGEVNNKFVISVIDFLLKYVDSKGDSNTFKPLLTKKGINESIWGDIRKKSLGTEYREEDVLKFIGEKINDNYVWIPNKENSNIPYIDGNRLFVIPFSVLSCMTTLTIYTDMKEVEMTMANEHLLHKAKPVLDNLIDALNKNFNVNNETSGGGAEWAYYHITPKDGSEVTPDFYFEVLDFILTNIQNTNDLEVFIEKK